jgi:hypothetical protein
LLIESLSPIGCFLQSEDWRCWLRDALLEMVNSPVKSDPGMLRPLENRFGGAGNLGSAIAPTATPIIVGSFSARQKTEDPQSGQKEALTFPPLAPSRMNSFLSPNGAPVRRWQSRQWQATTILGVSGKVRGRPPQTHCACVMKRAPNFWEVKIIPHPEPVEG